MPQNQEIPQVQISALAFGAFVHQLPEIAKQLKIADSVSKSEHSSPLFKYAMDQIERYVRDASSCGGRSFSYNVNALAPGYDKPDLHLRKAVAEELRKNGFSYCETQRSPNCVWFEVSW